MFSHCQTIFHSTRFIRVEKKEENVNATCLVIMVNILIQYRSLLIDIMTLDLILNNNLSNDKQNKMKLRFL